MNGRDYSPAAKAKRFRIGLMNALNLAMANDPEQRNDANETVAFARALEYVEADAVEILYAELMAAQLIPIKTGVPEWAEIWTKQAIDWFGAAKWISSKAEDLPFVELKGAQVSYPIKPFGIAYAYTVFELRASAHYGIPLDAARARAADRAIAEFIDRILAFGDASLGIPGFVNQAGVTVDGAAQLPNGGDFANSTPAEVVEDIDYIVRVIPDATNDVVKEDGLTVVFPSSLQTFLTTTDVSAGTTLVSILQRVKDKHPNVTFTFWNQLNLADAAGTGPRIITYRKGNDVLEGVALPNVETTPPQQRGFGVEIFKAGKCGGTVITLIGAVRYFDDA